jgi:hypothetical protein
MKAPEPTDKSRKPQINVAVSEQEKDLFEQIAAKRGMKTAALLRSLAYDEGRRLGIIK